MSVERTPDPRLPLVPTGDLDIPPGVLDDVPFGIALLTVPELTFTYSNHVYESWYRPERRPIVGKHLQEALVAAPQVVATFRDVAERGEPAHFHDAEFVGLKDRPVVLPGDVTRWDWSIWPLKNSDGLVSHLVVSGYDVTAPAQDRMRLVQTHEEGVRALLEVSRATGSTGTMEEFFADLSFTVARLVGARKVVFAKVDGGIMSAQLRTHGFDDEAIGGLHLPCVPEGDGLVDRIVYRDEVFNAPIGSSPELQPYRAALEVMDVHDAIATSWQVGDLRLGLVAAFNSRRPGGFNDEDLHLLRVASMGAGLVWQHRLAQARIASAQRAETARLRESADQLAALERTKADFLRMVSHEMRGPISVIAASAAMLREQEEAATLQVTQHIIREKVDELSRMVDQLLEVSRLEDPTLKPSLSEFDVIDLLDEAAEQARRTHSGREIKVDAGPEPMTMRADRARILLIVTNLLDNALKYSPSGGSVSVRAERRGGMARLQVTDHGIGIEPQDVGRLFGRFTRVGEATGTIAGTGLGLYLCREAARLHGGDVTVESTPGKGSVFTAEIPLVTR